MYSNKHTVCYSLNVVCFSSYKGRPTGNTSSLLNINQNRKIPDPMGGIPTNLPSNSTAQLNINTATKCYQMGNVKYPT